MKCNSVLIIKAVSEVQEWCSMRPGIVNGDDTKDVAYTFACHSGYNQDAPYALSFVFKAIRNNNTAFGGRATHFEAANSSSVLEVLITTRST